MTYLDLAAEQEREQLNTGTKPVAESHRFDEDALHCWMTANVAGYAGPLEVRQFKGGQSNPTYQLITPNKKYVLRRKPPGKLLPSAHAVDREYKVITALGTTGFPVARTYGLCTDEAVIGTWFYIMDMVEGRILWDQTLPQYQPAERRAIFMAKIAKQKLDIRSNSIHPTFIDTPILDFMREQFGKAETDAKLARQVPLGRIGVPDDIANAVLYLASDESRFMTGAELKLDGGISAM
jgi:hypothetical protein